MNERYLFFYCLSLLISTTSLLPSDGPRVWFVEIANNVSSAVEKVAGAGILSGTVLDARKGPRLGNGYAGAPTDRGTAPTGKVISMGSARDDVPRGIESSGYSGGDCHTQREETDTEFYQRHQQQVQQQSETMSLGSLEKEIIKRQEALRRDRNRCYVEPQEKELAILEAEYAKRQPKPHVFERDMSDSDLDKNIRNYTDKLEDAKAVLAEASKPDFWGRKADVRVEQGQVDTLFNMLERVKSEKTKRVREQPKKKVPTKKAVQMRENKEPKMPTILEKSPFEDSDDLPSKGGPIGPLTPGQVIGVAGLAVAAKVAGTAMVAAPVGGTVVGIGGGAVAGKTACVVVATNPALWVPAAVVATVVGVGGLGYLAYNKLYSTQKAPKLIVPNLGNGSNNNQPSNPGNPKDPKEPKERKFNTVQKTEGLRKLKENYRYDKQTKLYKLRENGTPIKCTRTGKPVENVKWDHSHGDIEALKKNLDHMGSLDPVTFEMYKGPEITRREL